MVMLKDLFLNFALLISLSVLSTYLERVVPKEKYPGKISIGILFGIVTVVGMSFPYTFIPGIIFDGRSVIISVEALFLGPVATIITSVIALAYRIYLGGAGVVMGSSVIAASAIIGLVFFRLREKKFIDVNLKILFLLGLSVHLAMILLMVTLPSNYFWSVFVKLFVSIILIYVSSTIILGLLLLDQERKNHSTKLLADSEERLRLATELADVAVWEYDFATNSMARSNNHDRLYGLKRQRRWSIETFLDAVHPDDREFPNKIIEKSVAPGGPNEYKYDFRVIYPDKSIHWLMVTGQIIERDTEGKGRIVRGCLFDVTERKLTEQALRLNEQRMRVIVEGTPHLFFYTQDQNANNTYLSPTVQKITGYSVEQWLGNRDWFTTDAEINNEARKLTYAHLKGEFSDTPILLEIRHADGHLLTLEVFENPIIENGKVIGLQGVAHDITERIKAEQEIRLLAHSLESISECVSITDINNNVLFVNDSFLKTYGFSKEELIGKNITVVQPRSLSNQDMQQEILDKSILGGWKGELTNRRKDGSEFPVFLSTSVIKDVKGNPLALIGVATDITEAKRAREDLINAKEKAEQSNELKTEFLAQMSHEIRSPMNVTLNMVNIIKDELDEKLYSRLASYFNGIDSAGRRLIRTVDLILNASEIQIGSYQPTWDKVDLNKDVMNSILTEYYSQVQTAGLKLNYACVLSEPVVIADKYSVQQIFANLIDNAIKYTNQGSVNVTIDMDVEQNVRVVISDTGIGMSKEFMTQMFEPFMQEERGYSRRYEGNGLGLSLVKKYCELNRAAISVESKKGKGSTFTLTFLSKHPFQHSHRA